MPWVRKKEEHPTPVWLVFFTGIFGFINPPAPAAEPWKFDVLRLKNGAAFQGILVSENSADVRFQCVRRRPGSATVVISTTFKRAEIDQIERLESQDRAILAARIRALDPNGKGEAVRMEHLELKSFSWLSPRAADALSYSSTYFILVSNAREDIIRRSAVRLEQIYSAYSRYMPARRRSAKPTKIFLVRSMAEYQQVLRDRGQTILNPAFYDSGRNEVLCASDLEQLGEELELIQKKHRTILEELKQLEFDLNKQYKGKIPSRIAAPLQGRRQQIYKINLKNDTIFKNATQQLFQTLYHEAFHAYLANFVYPGDEAAVPRWLNEGLAQIFETAILEAGEIRIGHADPKRLAALKAAERNHQLVPLRKLLGSGPQQFLIAHANDQQISDRYYLNSWALCFYLMFERRLLGTPMLDGYVHGLQVGKDPLAAFSELVGEPLPRFDDAFQRYIPKLREEGIAGRTDPPK